MALEQAELHRSAGRLGAGATAELGQDVADVHVDGAWAEEQPLGDLAVGAPDRDKAQHLDLTPRQAGVLKLARRPSTESSLDLLAEVGELLGRGGCQPTQRRDGVVTLLPVGDAGDEVAGTVQRVVDATSQGVGASDPWAASTSSQNSSLRRS